MSSETKANEIANEMASEQLRAEKQWDFDFDKKNTLNDWITYIVVYLGKAGSMRTPVKNRRPALIKAGGLLISALKAMDEEYLPLRHYDKVDDEV